MKFIGINNIVIFFYHLQNKSILIKPFHYLDMYTHLPIVCQFIEFFPIYFIEKRLNFIFLNLFWSEIEEIYTVFIL